MPASTHVAVNGAGEPQAEAEPPERLRVEIVRQSGDWTAFGDASAAAELAAVTLASHPEVELRPATACIALANDEDVRALNRAYRGIDKPTNVLSFPASAAPIEGIRHLGDVVVAEETVLREAVAGGVKPTHHLQHLVVHGLLHLLGHVHDSDPEAAAMERLEVAILARLGIADPYCDGAI